MFEYNDYWRQSGGRLASVVGLLQRSNFRLWRLSRLMNIPVRSDGRDLENFRHSIYVAILDGAPR